MRLTVDEKEKQKSGRGSAKVKIELMLAMYTPLPVKNYVHEKGEEIIKK